MTQHSKLLATRRKKQAAENKRRIDLKNTQRARKAALKTAAA